MGGTARSQANQGTTFYTFNRNKTYLTLNLRKAKGKKIFEQPVARSDVVLDNFAPGALDRMGLGYEWGRKVKPPVIYFARMPVSLITLVHLTTSAFTVDASSSGELATMSKPAASNLCRTSESFNAIPRSWLSCLMIADGVPLRAKMAYTTLDSYPSKPALATVGRSGNFAEGCRVVIASARTFPDLMCGAAAEDPAKNI